MTLELLIQDLDGAEVWQKLQNTLECVSETAKKLSKPEAEILIVMDSKHRGIKYAFENQTDKKIPVLTEQGIKYYDSTGKFSISLDEKARINAELSVKYIRVNTTGVRASEIIKGVDGISNGCLIELVSGSIPPSKKDLDDTRLFPDLYNKLLQKLKDIPFFSGMTDIDIDRWLLQNQSQDTRDFDFEDVTDDNTTVRVIEVGKSKMQLQVAPEDITIILSSESLTFKELKSYFPRKPGSRARHHTLMFFPYRWALNIDTSLLDVDDYEGPTEKIYSLDDDGRKIFIIDLDEKNKLAVKINAAEKINSYDEILIEYSIKNSNDSLATVKRWTKNFTAAGYKSLLQKLIRYTPKDVLYQIPEDLEALDATQVLLATFTILLTHPGSFVPDIQRFITGQESAFKRLAVSIFEDSFIENPKKLERLLVMALLSQRMPSWRPSKEIFLECLEICVEAINSKKAYYWDLEEGSKIKSYKFKVDGESFANCAALLEVVKSFGTDISMVKYIAKHAGKTRYISFERPSTMYLERCIDQHWAPEIAYLLPVEIVDKFIVTGSTPYSILFSQIFHQHTGQNPRKNKGHDIDPRFVENIENAQYLLLMAKQITLDNKQVHLVTKETYELKVELSKSWIAGMLGAVDVPGKPQAMVTLIPDQPETMIAIRKPSRGMKDGTLTDERSEAAIKYVKKLLNTKGIALRACNAPIQELKGYTLKLEYVQDDDGTEIERYIFVKGRDIKTWDEIIDDQSTMHIKILKEVEVDTVFSIRNFEKIIKFHGEGIMKNSYKKLKELLINNYRVKEIRRALSYLTAYRMEIEVCRLSKDGGGTSIAASRYDIGAGQILLYISLLYPAALQLIEGGVTKFKVVNAPLVWEIRNYINEYVNRTKEGVKKSQKGWGIFKDSSKRKIKNYQKEVIDEMMTKTNIGKKGHFIWLTVGLGKTMILLEWICKAIKINKLSKYVIYTLPKTALKTIITEIEYFSIPINLLLPIKSWKSHPQKDYVIDPIGPQPYMINLIEHDHLRLLEDTLIDIAPDSLFVIDEVHKALNDTKRTSVTLEISRGSKDFVAMTGTPMVDSNTYKLIWWLEQIVDFEVNEKNFWVAANGMIAKKVNTGIETDHKEILAEMTDLENIEYKKLIPKNLGGKNQASTNKDFMNAFALCYKICDRKMIDVTKKFLSENKGVMLVAKDSKHSQKLKELFIKKGVDAADILVMDKNTSIFMTDKTVENGTTPDYKVVIVPKSKSAGYTLSRLKSMVTCVYPSNLADRSQLEGRINRLSQTANIIYYRTIHTGILTYVMQKHNDAANITKVLSALAKNV